MARGAVLNKHYRTQKQQLKRLSKQEFLALREMAKLAKNMYNVAVYNIRQHYFDTKTYLKYTANYPVCKENENYGLLNSNMAQQILKEADSAFKSFFGLLALAKKGKYGYRSVKLPRYLPKDGYTTLIIGMIRIKEDGILDVPMSPCFKRLYGKVSIKVPSNLQDKKIKEIRIIPKNRARFFEVQYTYEVPETERNLNPNNALAIDLGIDNLCTCVTNTGDTFIIDGKKLKSINAYANKENARLQSIKDKQKIKYTTKAQCKLWQKRSNRVNDYIAKTCRHIINYCLMNDIGTLVIGYNQAFQRKADLGKSNNQNFVNLPVGNIKERLEYMCEYYGIRLKEQEESYTSKSDFLSNDILPQLNLDKPQTYTFQGKRISRGQYKSSTGKVLNADVNGAYNILRKANVCDLSDLQQSQSIKQPMRLRIA